MTRFIYSAKKEGGDVYRGVADVGDAYEVYAQIRREGGTVISVEEDTSGSPWSIAYWNRKFSTVPEHEKVTFAQTLAAMLKAGLALSRALSVMERQTRNPKMRQVLTELQSAVRQGSTFHSALSRFPKVFSPLFIAMVRAGEESGDVSGALKIVGEQMEKMFTLKKKVRGAMIYPSIVVIAIVIISILMITQVVPTLAATFEELGADLPTSTRVMISISDFLIGNTILALTSFVLLVVGMSLALRTHVGRRGKDWFFMHLPIIGTIVKEVNAARTARTLSSLLSSGVNMVVTIEITKDVVQNSYFKDVLAVAEQAVQQGEPLAKSFALNEHLYPPLVGEMIAVGEETGDLTHMLENLAIFYEEEVFRKTKDMSTIIEPFLMVIIGTAVGFFAVSMISPIYSLSDAI